MVFSTKSFTDTLKLFLLVFFSFFVYDITVLNVPVFFSDDSYGTHCQHAGVLHKTLFAFTVLATVTTPANRPSSKHNTLEETSP